MTDVQNIFDKIAAFTGLSSLAVEAGFLLITISIVLVVIFMVLAVFRIRKEVIKVNVTLSYIARLLTKGYERLGPEGPSLDSTQRVVVEMLMQGHSYDEIQKRVDVSQEYVDIVRWMTKQKLIAKE
jgi:DNA-binding CsgD family transcriptional regulator